MKKNKIIFFLIFILAATIAGCGFFWGSISGGTQYVYQQVSSGWFHSCALSTAGKVRCWGYAGDGALGYGNTNDVGDGIGLSITQAGDVNVGGTVTQICTAYRHTCALLNTGNVRCWGWGFLGALGYNNFTTIGDDELPSTAGDVPVGGTVTQISCRGYHTCALLSTGAMRCWGENGSGQLGYNNTTAVGTGGISIIAAGDVPVGGTVTYVGAGGGHTCAILSSGNIRCWGENTDGRLGYNNTTTVGNGIGPSIIAAGDVPLGGTATYVEGWQAHTCATLTTGGMRCWGDDTSQGSVGYGLGNVGNGIAPSIIAAGDLPLGTSVLKPIVGMQHSCALLSNNQLKCWSYSFEGELGINISSAGRNATTTTQVYLGPGLSVRQATAGGRTTCVITSADRVRCWGTGEYGRNGYGTTSDISDGIGLTIPQAGDLRIFE